MKLTIEGMSCEHCVSRIRNALSGLGAALDAADLTKKEIDVNLQGVALSEAIETIADLGFEARQV